MHSLCLSPIPRLQSPDSAAPNTTDDLDFVDEGVISALLTGSTSSPRPLAIPADLALAADDMDFAGWCLPAPAATTPLAETETRLSPTPLESSAPRMFSPFVGLADETPRPVVATLPPVEPGLGTPHHGTHRWWLAAVAGVLCTLFVSVLLVHFAARPGTPLEGFWKPAPPAAIPQPALEDAADQSTADIHPRGTRGL